MVLGVLRALQTQASLTACVYEGKVCSVAALGRGCGHWRKIQDVSVRREFGSQKVLLLYVLVGYSSVVRVQRSITVGKINLKFWPKPPALLLIACKSCNGGMRCRTSAGKRPQQTHRTQYRNIGAPFRLQVLVETLLDDLEVRVHRGNLLHHLGVGAASPYGVGMVEDLLHQEAELSIHLCRACDTGAGTT